MKASGCAKGSCSLSRADNAAPSISLSSLPPVTMADSSQLGAPNREEKFAVRVAVFLPLRPSPPDPPPPRA